jgi:hypothetical protein
MNTLSCTSSPPPGTTSSRLLLVRLINHRDRYLPLPFRAEQEPGLCVCICVTPHSVPLCFVSTELVGRAGILWHLYNALITPPTSIPWRNIWCHFANYNIPTLSHWRMVLFQVTLSSSKEQQRLLWNWWKKWQTTAKVRASRMLWCATCTRRA